ncbi:transposase [Streptomyces clavifer]|uniref:transposase n=1 Tax=Streptomyces clavifer TaxID=68188 RepID=UPI00381D9CDB
MISRFAPAYWPGHHFRGRWGERTHLKSGTGSGLGKVRWVVERAFAWLHQFKRLRIRYERRADLHQGLLELAGSLICLRRLRTSL